MAGKRTSLAALAGAKVEDVPGRSDAVLLTLPLEKLHCTRFNPRRNFGTDDELREFGQKLKKEQLQPAVVVSRAAYLKLWPGEADNVGTCSYVIANGERRYRASRLVGRPLLEVVHREDVAQSRADFLDAVQSENNDRQDLDPIERAIAIETMVTELGGADQVAVYYNKTKGWVSQQRKLLRLTPELQDLVSSGDMPVRVAREIAGLPAETQAAAWAEELNRRSMEKAAGARLRAQAANPPEPAPAPSPTAVERFTAVNQQPIDTALTPSARGEEQPRFTAVNRGDDAAPAPDPSPEVQEHAPQHFQPVPAQPADGQGGVPEPREPSPSAPAPTAAGGDRRQVLFPYDNGLAAAQFLIERMSVLEFKRLLDRLTEHYLEMADKAPGA